MIEAKQFGTEEWSDKKFYFPESVSLSFDTFRHDEKAKYKVLICLEPKEILSRFGEHFDIYRLNMCDPYLINYVKETFDLVICWNEELLSRIPQSKKFINGECFLDLNNLNYNKKNKISFLTSSKVFTEGHLLRLQIYNAFKNFNLIKNFEYHKHLSPPRLEHKNEILNDSKFSIVMENSRNNNYITEKIIDCFVSKTIPIYWGAPNVGEFFNTEGIITFNNIDDLIIQLFKIEDGLYESKIYAIEDNYNRAKNFFPLLDRIEKEIRENFWGAE